MVVVTCDNDDGHLCNDNDGSNKSDISDDSKGNDGDSVGDIMLMVIVLVISWWWYHDGDIMLMVISWWW